MISKSRIDELVKKYKEDIVSFRRYIHENPELSNEEINTPEFIIKQLKKWGVKYKYPIAKTGILAYIEGKNPEKRKVALRGDMDALPIEEQTNLSYASKNKGVMHACGHDVHIACLLGVAKVFSSIKEEFEGTIIFIFQPSEEKLPGGALPMIEDGIFNEYMPDAILAQHVEPDIPVGKIGVEPGIRSAAVDEIIITVKGKGAHGAYPHKAIDPILIASQIIISLGQIVSSNVDAKESMTLSFGSIHGGNAINVIPDNCVLKGTIRSTSEHWRDIAHQRIRLISAGIAEGFGGSVEITINKGYPAINNDNSITQRIISAGIEYLGEGNVAKQPQKMGGEDFAYFQKEIPGVLYVLGTKDLGSEYTYPLHNPKFDVDEKSLEIGTGTMIWLALNELKFEN